MLFISFLYLYCYVFPQLMSFSFQLQLPWWYYFNHTYFGCCCAIGIVVELFISLNVYDAIFSLPIFGNIVSLLLSYCLGIWGLSLSRIQFEIGLLFLWHPVRLCSHCLPWCWLLELFMLLVLRIHPAGLLQLYVLLLLTVIVMIHVGHLKPVPVLPDV